VISFSTSQVVTSCPLVHAGSTSAKAIVDTKIKGKMREYIATPHTLQAAASTHFNSTFSAKKQPLVIDDVVNQQFFKSVKRTIRLFEV